MTLGDLGTGHCPLGAINAVIVDNYLTTLGRDPTEDAALLDDLQIPIKALKATLSHDLLWRLWEPSRPEPR